MHLFSILDTCLEFIDLMLRSDHDDIVNDESQVWRNFSLANPCTIEHCRAVYTDAAHMYKFISVSKPMSSNGTTTQPV